MTDLIKLNKVLRELGFITFPAWNDNGKVHPFVSWTPYRDLNRQLTKEEFAKIDKDFFDERCCAIQYIPGIAYDSNGEKTDYWPFYLDADNLQATNELKRLSKEDPTFEGLATKIQGLLVEPSDSKEKLHVHGLAQGEQYGKIKLEPKEGRQSNVPFIEFFNDGKFLATIGKPGYYIINEDNEVRKFSDMSRVQNSTTIKKFFDNIKERFKDGYPPETKNDNNTINGNRQRRKWILIDTKDGIVNKGSRGEQWNAYCCHMLRKYWSKKPFDEIKEMVMDTNQKRCNPPLGDDKPNEPEEIWKQAFEFISDEVAKDGLAGDAKSKKIISEATELIMNKHKFITIQETDEILYYENGVYLQGGDKIIAKDCEKMFYYDLNNERLNQILGHIIRQTYVKHEELDTDKNIINLKNGLYHLNEDLLTPHTPDYLSINQKPIIYNKEAKAQRFEKFIREVIAQGQIRTAFEAMAYTFERDYPIEVIFMLYGNGANGKSVFTSTLSNLHGVEHVSNVTLSQMIEDVFALSDLENRDLNIDNELGSENIKDTGIIKRLTGGSRQPIRIQRKNQRAYDTVLYAKLFFNANKIPVSEDMTNAFNRRIVIIAFPYTFEGKNDDRKLKDKLTTEEEKSGIFNILMKALRNIRKTQNIYVNEKTTEERRLRYLRATDSIKAFMQEVIAKDSTEGDSIYKDDLHLVYSVYCKKHRIPAQYYDDFCKRVKKTKITAVDENDEEIELSIGESRKNTVRKDEKGNPIRKYCWTHIKLNPEYEKERLLLNPDEKYEKEQTKLVQ